MSRQEIESVEEKKTITGVSRGEVHNIEQPHGADAGPGGPGGAPGSMWALGAGTGCFTNHHSHGGACWLNICTGSRREGRET